MPYEIKTFRSLSQRPVNQDGYVKEWVEEGFIAMESPQDPKPSLKIEVVASLNSMVNAAKILILSIHLLQTTVSFSMVLNKQWQRIQKRLLI